MNAPVILAAVYLLQLGGKAALALVHGAREPAAAPQDLRRLTVIQAVQSGDETLEAVLRENLRTLVGAAMIWVVDRTDAPARRLGERCQAGPEGRNLRLLETDEPPAGCNPKTWKLAAALPGVETEFLAVVDDDTRLPRRSADRLVGALVAGADLATGLPSYQPARGYLSVLLAEFVNSAAILTYLSAAACAPPRTINGMGYALRTALARERALFTACQPAITDDLAVAQAVRRAGGRIVQTAQPQFISTTVAGPRHYLRLMHRWFVFTRLLVENETRAGRLLVILAYGLHPLLLAGLVVAACFQPAALVPLLLVVVVRAAVLLLLNRRFAGGWRHAPLASLAAELLQPVFLAGACLFPVIWWRRRRIRVRTFHRFEYLSP